MSTSSTRNTRGVNAVNRALLQELVPALVPCLKACLENGINRELAEFKRLWLETLMQAEVNELVGTPYERTRNGAHRWGYEKGLAVCDGGKITVTRPRARISRNLGDGEIQLQTYKAMNRADLLDGPLVRAILSGVSSRGYSKLICQNFEARGIKKSSVSRKFIEATKPVVEAFLNRDLSKLDLVVLFLDGVVVSKMNAIAAIGVDTRGRKHVLGLQLGSTENETVCRDLFRSMIERGLNCERSYLFVVDGSKALGTAIRTAFGQFAVIQRCQEHKIRDVQAYVPMPMRNEIRQKMMAAYNQKTHSAALKRLSKLRDDLILLRYQTAANALTEGMYETVTINRLKVTGQLRTSLRTTNIIESAFSSVRRHIGKVSRFRSEEHRDRHLIWSLIEAEKNFRTVLGYRNLLELQMSLAKSTKSQLKPF